MQLTCILRDMYELFLSKNPECTYTIADNFAIVHFIFQDVSGSRQ